MAFIVKILIGFVGCIVLTFFLLHSDTIHGISQTRKIFQKFSLATTKHFQEMARDTCDSCTVVDQHIKEIQNDGRRIQVKTAIAPDAQELILLVSSLGRGGSSWIGELLSNITDAVIYMFEPLKIVTDIYDSRITPAYSKEVLSQVFACQFSKDMAIYQLRRKTFFKKFPDDCKTQCRTRESISRRCRLAETVIVKTIRMPLANVEDLLIMPSFRHLKVIYLARDTRAQVLSRSHVFSSKNSDFNNECARVETDVFTFPRLSKQFPGHFYFMRYEDVCQDPLGEAAQLWRFLRTNHTAEMPASWTTFLSEHLQHTDGAKKRENPYSTYRNTSTEWYKWRLEMKNYALKLLNLEKVCQAAMDKLGYAPLHTVQNIRNLSMPFVRNISCDFWNCWSYKF